MPHPPRGYNSRMSDLNPAQLAASTHGDGPLLIIAGAGTGKTRTLVHRVAHLIQRGVKPERILLLTFTRRAAQEMLGRVERLVGAACHKVQGGTFHATAHRLLRRYGAAAGIANDFTIMDQEDSADLMHMARVQLGYGDKTKRFPKKETLQRVYSRHVNTEIPVGTILAEEYPQFAGFLPDFAKIFADYTARKGNRNLVDYDDLLLFWAGMLEHSPEVANKIASLYDHILVDEYQDTNLLQARVLRGLCRNHRNVTVVGDDAQSVYSFRGASFRNILDFPQQFEGTSIVTLEQNYRSTQPILDTTNTLISRAKERFTKVLFTTRTGGERPWLVTAKDEEEQTRFVVDRILELYESGTPLREMAVLFRAGYMSAAIEIELTNRKIPFEKWGGLRFLEAAHVKDVLAFLRVLENPRDEVSWYRILLAPAWNRRPDRARRNRRDGPGRVGVGVVREIPRTSPRPCRARVAHHAARHAAFGRDHADRERRHCPRAEVVRRHPARALRPGRAAPRGPRPVGDDRRQIPEPLGFSLRTRPRAAVEHPRPRGRRPRGRGRAGPEHRALRQGQGVGRGLPDLGGRRLVPDIACAQR